jgi:hypothetical protein
MLFKAGVITHCVTAVPYSEIRHKLHGAEPVFEKVIGPELVEFPTPYGTQRFITAFTRTHHVPDQSSGHALPS